MSTTNNTTATLAAARGTLLSIALRLTSFLLSQLTLRSVSAAALGSASVPLELLLSTALFVGREGFRLALTKEIGNDDHVDGKEENRNLQNNIEGDNRKKINRDDDGEPKNDAQKSKQQTRDQQHQQKVTNVSWLSVPMGTILSILALWIHLSQCNRNSTPDSDEQHLPSSVRSEKEYYALLDYKMAGILYCLAAFVEILSEPLVIRYQQQMDVTTKAKAEGAALIMKSVSCFGCLYLTRCGILGGNYPGKKGASEADFAVTAFGISQLVYAMVFTTILYSKGGIHWPRAMAFPSSSIKNPYSEKANSKKRHATTKESPLSIITHNFDLHALYLVLLFTLQGLFKHALTEGDKIVLSALAGSYDQGVYAIATSYGGLAARMLLQPMEENARLLFSRQGALLVAQQQHLDNSSAGDNNHAKDEGEGSRSSDSALKVLSDFEDIYFFLTRVVVYIGLIFAAIATNYTSVLLRVLAGSQWGSNAAASDALSAFCVYTAFLALNGTTEAFVYGVSRSGNDVGKIGIVHAIVGGVFALIAPGLVKTYGAVGLVAANCVAMALRSMYSLYFSHCYFSHGEKRQNIITGTLFRMMPHGMVLGAFGASFVITRASRGHIYDAAIAVGGSWIVAGIQHIGVGVLCLGATATLSLWLENDIRSSLSTLIKRKID